MLPYVNLELSQVKKPLYAQVGRIEVVIGNSKIHLGNRLRIIAHIAAVYLGAVVNESEHTSDQLRDTRIEVAQTGIALRAGVRKFLDCLKGVFQKAKILWKTEGDE